MTVESPITPELKMIKRRPLIEENLERPHPQLSRGRGTVMLEGNPLSELSRSGHIPGLQNRGVKVEFDR